MISYKLALKPGGFDAALTTLTIEGRVCCADSLSTLATAAGVMFVFADTTSVEAHTLGPHRHDDSEHEPGPPETDTPTAA